MAMMQYHIFGGNGNVNIAVGMKWCEQRDFEFLKCMTITIIKSSSLTRTNVFVDFKIANTYNRKALDLF
jgi:hypothetical protein